MAARYPPYGQPGQMPPGPPGPGGRAPTTAPPGGFSGPPPSAYPGPPGAYPPPSAGGPPPVVASGPSKVPTFNPTAMPGGRMPMGYAPMSVGGGGVPVGPGPMGPGGPMMGPGGPMGPGPMGPGGPMMGPGGPGAIPPPSGPLPMGNFGRPAGPPTMPPPTAGAEGTGEVLPKSFFAGGKTHARPLYPDEFGDGSVYESGPAAADAGMPQMYTPAQSAAIYGRHGMMPQQQQMGDQQQMVESFQSLSLGGAPAGGPRPGTAPGMPMPGHPGQPQGMGQGQPMPEVDTTSFPRPVEFQIEEFPGLIEPKNEATQTFLERQCDDDMQCHPRYMRVSVGALPNSASLQERFALPLGVFLQPLARAPDHDEVPLVNFGPAGIIRCKRCRTYINPFSTFTEGGRKWRCNICGLLNEVPADYYCTLDANGQRRDLDERPELCKGTVEFIAPKEYMVRPPQPPVYVFCIDVSHRAVASGMLAQVVETIRAQIRNIQGQERLKIGLITFDSTVHFYNMKPGLSQPQMIVVSDLDDIFLPVPDDLLANASTSMDIIEQLLERLPSMFAETSIVESCLGSAIQAAFLAMQSIGGKLCIFQSTLPNTGVAKLVNRENPQLMGTEKEMTILRPDELFYKKMSVECSRHQICVEIFLTPHEYIDVATLAPLARHTSGRLFYYPGFLRDRDGTKLNNELTKVLTATTGWEAVMRVRCSRGLRVSMYHGNFFVRAADLLALPNVSQDHTFAVQIAHEETVLSGNTACIQSALLYTTSSGERRIRVNTLSVPVTSVLGDLFRMADINQLMSLMARAALELSVANAKLSDGRQWLQDKCVEALRSYRSICNSQFRSPSQLIFPDTLKCLPLYVLALLKNPVFRPDRDVRADERAYYMEQMNTMTVKELGTFLYPTLFALHEMPGDCGIPGENGLCKLPPLKPLSVESLRHDGIFLLEDGQIIFLWIGKAAPPPVYADLFGPGATPTTDTTQLILRRLDNDFNKRVNAIVDTTRMTRVSHPAMYVVRQGEPLEQRFASYLIEDRTFSTMSYMEFLCFVQKQISGGR
eukprot:TRINITY_DN2302_c0_g1::TRINITY_DN2302_c0_g1_i1::g.20823::m.20823 TRINITY_DN2302_c0_g1::TRINITY_DN2302_c0_g1_i1::g.20823  ORF type:complete len:1061 (-),score=273.42,sp/Q9SFU0/SC24A_ARATH/43.63/0.0,Sec23_trunk/PF04811.10/2.3e-73,Sec23_helical/PF04815.10/4.5e-25,Sec23_BS/PF08033.7/7.1e-22,zf-Sec23_Sec24/PF04810.10/1.1e-19,Gelsolin/PF00626.17/8.5e-07,Sen15/PF09631.5/0.00044 TRINITY_DN2302_c0_g1_i1:511-3654(-)